MYDLSVWVCEFPAERKVDKNILGYWRLPSETFTSRSLDFLFQWDHVKSYFVVFFHVLIFAGRSTTNPAAALRLYIKWCMLWPDCISPSASYRLWSTCLSSSSSHGSCTRGPPAGWRRSSSERAFRSSSSRSASSWVWTAAAQRTWCSRRSDSSHLMTDNFHQQCTARLILTFVVTVFIFIYFFVFFYPSPEFASTVLLINLSFFPFLFHSVFCWLIFQSFAPTVAPSLDSLGVWSTACLSVVMLWGCHPSQ